HIAAGDPGKVIVADYEAKHLAQAGTTPVWYAHFVQSLDLLSDHPHVTDQAVTDIPAYRWTASEMMGVCGAPTPVQGVPNGGGCLDKLAPVSRFRGSVRATRRGLRLAGHSYDLACAGGRAGRHSTATLRTIRVAIARRLANRRCRFMLGNGRFGAPVSCLRTT